MSVVAGVDFGTLSVRVSVVDSERGRLGHGIAEYPLHRKREDPDHATQSHSGHMGALVSATKKALDASGVPGPAIEAIALDTTGSSVVPVGENLVPLDDYYLWCDHRSAEEAALITETATRTGLEAIRWCGGVYSSEWGFSKLLHWLRHNPEKRDRFVTAFEHCDMVAATLCGVTDPSRAARSICAMGHKWMWNESWCGLPPESFLEQVDPLLKGVRAKFDGRYATSDKLAGHLSPEWAQKLGLRSCIPIPVGAFDAHWDAIGAGVNLGSVVNVIGSSTCIIAVAENVSLIPGVCGVVRGSVHPKLTGVEAGLSATGDLFETIARRAGSTAADLSRNLARYRAGETGLLRFTWDNGDRTVLVNPELGGMCFGWNLMHTAEDELFAAIEGTAFHTRIILERMQEHGLPVERVIHGGGIPQKNDALNRVYANVLNKPILIPETDTTSLGSAIFAFLAAGAFSSLEEAQQKLCPKYRVVEPDPRSVPVCDELYRVYKSLYFSFGKPGSSPAAFGHVLPALRRIAAQVRGKN
jgi:L-ribulokinase